jgi:hypothetical protein
LAAKLTPEARAAHAATREAREARSKAETALAVANATFLAAVKAEEVHQTALAPFLIEENRHKRAERAAAAYLAMSDLAAVVAAQFPLSANMNSDEQTKTLAKRRHVLAQFPEVKSAVTRLAQNLTDKEGNRILSVDKAKAKLTSRIWEAVEVEMQYVKEYVKTEKIEL